MCIRSPIPERLRRRHLRDMKCTVHDLEVMGSNPGWIELGVRIILLSKSYLNPNIKVVMYKKEEIWSQVFTLYLTQCESRH